MSVAWRAAMVSTLQAIDGSSPYTLDLSGTGAVVVGRPPGSVQSSLDVVAYVYRLDSTDNRGDAAPLRSWHRVQNVGISFYVTADTTSGADREAVMDAIHDDLHSALSVSLVTGGALATAGILQAYDLRLAPFYGSQQVHSSSSVIVDAQLTLDYIDDGST